MGIGKKKKKKKEKMEERAQTSLTRIIDKLAKNASKTPRPESKFSTATAFGSILSPPITLFFSVSTTTCTTEIYVYIFLSGILAFEYNLSKLSTAFIRCHLHRFLLDCGPYDMFCSTLCY